MTNWGLYTACDCSNLQDAGIQVWALYPGLMSTLCKWYTNTFQTCFANLLMQLIQCIDSVTIKHKAKQHCWAEQEHIRQNIKPQAAEQRVKKPRYISISQQLPQHHVIELNLIDLRCWCSSHCKPFKFRTKVGCSYLYIFVCILLLRLSMCWLSIA